MGRKMKDGRKEGMKEEVRNGGRKGGEGTTEQWEGR